MVQGAWAILMSRHSGEQDVVFGATRAGRNAPVDDIGSMVGLFINTLPVRAQLSPDEPLIHLLQTLRQQSIDQRPFEHTPLVKIQEWGELSPGTPLFESLLVFENYRLNETLRAQGGNWNHRDFHLVEQTHYPLTVAAYAGVALTLAIGFEKARSDQEEVERLLAHLGRLLEGMAAGDVEKPLSELQMLTDAEQHQMLVEWNATAANYPKDAGIHQLFEAQVERTPGAIAVSFADDQMTYRELNARANQLSHHLRKRGVRPGALVSICVEPSPDMLVGLLAILKAGGAYVPLDPAYPRERLTSMLRESRSELLLAQRNLRERLNLDVAETICLDAEWRHVASKSEENPANLTDPKNLAYVIFTSGSTGKPKGVEITHRGLVNHAHSIIKDYALQAQDRVLQFASLSFDVAAEELFPTWLSGAAVVLPPGGETIPPADLATQAAKHGISVLNLPASYWHDWVAELARSGVNLPPGLRLVVVGSEKVLPERYVTWRALTGDRVGWRNAYGLAEATISSIMYDPSVDSSERPDQELPIGRPLANTRLYVLDRDQQPVPIGVAGELYIGGDGLARGYLHQPGMTAESFIPDPFAGDPGGRLYRTGDLVRFLPDGNLEFVGRRDRQVKVRGYRIELGEIESALSELPVVEKVVVLATEESSAASRLIAYVVAADAAIELGELRSHASQKLPKYMVPTTFVLLDDLPLQPSGKIDRQALLELDGQNADSKETYIPPRTRLEADLADIWSGLLGVAPIGMEDDFFELGGHSLLAMQVISRVQEIFAVEIGLGSLFESPTVSGLAREIEAAWSADAVDQSPSIGRIVSEDPAPLSFSQERMWFIQRMYPENAAYNLPISIRFRGPLDLAVLGQSVNEMARRHENLRTTIRMVDDRPVQRIVPFTMIDLPLIDLIPLPAAQRDEEMAARARESILQPFDMVKGPLFRGVVFRLDLEEHVLLLTLHHAISDAWSTGVVLGELAAHYETFIAGKSSQLPELPIQFADFTQWQRRRYQGVLIERQMAYWRQQLAGTPPLLLPTDRPRPAVQTFRGKYQFTIPDSDLFNGLGKLSGDARATLFMMTLAAFKILLLRYTGQTDIAVGVPVANRRQLSTEKLIGPFVNTLVLRTDLSGDPSFRELLERVRRVTLEAYTHQDIPFEKLVAELQPERRLSHSPLFQVMFTHTNIPLPSAQFPDLDWELMEFERGATQYDLTMSITDLMPSRRIEIEYNCDLFHANTMSRLLAHYEVLLRNIPKQPDTPISQLPLLSGEDQRQLLVSWNATRVTFGGDSTLHRLFEIQVEDSPEATAVVFGNENITYQELNERANRLAHHLRQLKVGPGTIVGISLERSIEMVVGLLAVLKAGAAYLPIDPDLPMSRMNLMIEDSQTPILLTERGLANGVAPSDEIDVVHLARDEPLIARYSSDNPGIKVDSDQMAYLLYTSGSTGTPKGVQVQHGSVANFLSSMRSEPGLKKEDVLVSVTTLSFDISVLEIFLPLTTGAKLVLTSKETAADGDLLAATLSDAGATVMQATPTTWRLLLATGWQGDGTLKALCGGEAWPRELAEQLMPHCRSLWNMYGPTETTVWSAVSRLRIEDEDVVIGPPIANTQFYVLDPHLQPTPVGIPGELYIGGKGLSTGYWRRPRMTAERFVPDPFSNEFGGRLYRTGDQVRYRPDGRLAYLGRLDNQVKIRGFRIELGEIESVLAQHPGVHSALAAAIESEPGEKRLVSYLIPVDETRLPATSDLRLFVQQRLPDYMVPASFLFVDAFPLTPNKKVDRSALPIPDTRQFASGEPYVAPRNAVEQVVTHMMQELLALDQVSIHDNFFDLGGHSLMATRLLARLHEAFSVDVSLRTFFEAPTVAELASTLLEDPVEPAKVKRIAQLITHVNQLSDEKASELLQQIPPSRRYASNA
jgi:amino acid adenylation domain-containing protein